MDIGKQMYSWAADLFGVNRSITGVGVRETLAYFSNLIPDIKIQSIPSGTKAFDWEIPDEWSINSAYIEDEFGKRIVDFNSEQIEANTGLLSDGLHEENATPEKNAELIAQNRNKMADLEQLKEELGKLTILEAADLVKSLEEEWGVKAASGGGMMMAMPAGGADAVGE